MAKYVDGFVIPIAKKSLKRYLAVAKKSGKVWKEHGALEYYECVGEDLAVKGMTPFTKVVGCEKGETLVFSWIVYRSRAHRDKVNKQVMQDPRIAAMMADGGCPFDPMRMGYGGFEMKVSV